MARAPRRTISQRSELTFDVHTFGVQPDTREIFLHGFLDSHLEEEPGIDYRQAAYFVKNIRLLDGQNSRPILVHMSSVGGEWNYGMAIFDAISSCRSRVTVLAYAHARSMSSIVPQAADLRIITPNADFLIHHGSGFVSGPTPNIEAEVYWWERLKRRMLEIYAARMVRGPWFRKKRWSRQRIAEWLARELEKRPEYYMDAWQAVEWGLMDAVLGDKSCPGIHQLLNQKD